MAAPLLDIVRVFVAPDGRGGNLLGVLLDPGDLPEHRFQSIAAELGFSETVFVTERPRAGLRIFTPTLELPLAGHPLVGTSWLLHREGPAPSLLRPPAGEVMTWQEEGLTWVRAPAADAPEFDLLEVESTEAVEWLDGAPDGGGMTVAWAWSDERAGAIRARAFLPDLGVAEDEATGTAAIRLCDRLARRIRITQGTGSVLHARPAPGGAVDLGGAVTAVDRRRYG